MRISLSSFAPANLVRRVQPSQPASDCSFSVLRLDLVLSRGIPSAFRGGFIAHLFIYTAKRHRVISEFFMSRNCAQMALATESPSAQSPYRNSMDQPGKVANPARVQLNRENKCFPVRVRA